MGFTGRPVGRRRTGDFLPRPLLGQNGSHRSSRCGAWAQRSRRSSVCFAKDLPQTAQISGFVLAAAGIWLISRTEDDSPPEGIGMAALAGIGFAGFYLCMKQAGDASAFWLAAISKVASFTLTASIVLIGRIPRKIDRAGIAFGVLAGCLDVIGSVLFIRASQTGRLDAAVVLSSLYPAVTVLLARFILREHFTRWKALGMVAALLAVPMIAWR